MRHQSVARHYEGKQIHNPSEKARLHLLNHIPKTPVLLKYINTTFTEPPQGLMLRSH